MNEQRLTQLLRTADAGDSPGVRDPSNIASAARMIRRDRQKRTQGVIVAGLSLLIVIGSVATVSWRNVERDRIDRRVALAALRNQADQLDDEATERMDVIEAVARSKKAQKTPLVKLAKPKSPPRDISFELDQQREMAASIILQAADQLREAGRGDLANDRYHDLISLFPDTAATQIARERLDQTKNRT